MPGFDGKGPRGTGPFSGGGRGYCAVVLPQPEEGQAPYGYAGLQGTSVQYDSEPPASPGWRGPIGCPGRGGFGRCHGRGRRGCW